LLAMTCCPIAKHADAWLKSVGKLKSIKTLANIKDAIVTTIDMMKEQGEPVATQPAEIHELVVAQVLSTVQN
jgi:hypothetical protein